MVFEIVTSESICAPVSVVSSILYDFNSYNQWNPFVRKISGDSAVGGKLDIIAGPPGKPPMNFKPDILQWEEGELRWAGIFLSKFLLVGEHYFVMKPSENGTEFVHGERFTGLLSPVMKMMMGKETAEGFRQMNTALKERAEKAASST